jgi:hypothetical protein
MKATRGPQAVPSPSDPTHLPPEDVALDEIKRALRTIEFGSVLIKIHQGEVVGIETSTKVRIKDRQDRQDR